MLYKKFASLNKYFERNLLNILFILILFNSSKHFIYGFNYVRGVLVDYSIFRISISSIVLSFILLCFYPLFKKKKALIFLILFITFTNILFSSNVFFSLIYMLNFFPIFLTVVIFWYKDLALSYKLVYIVNIFYIFIFLVQFFAKSSFFPYFPFGFFFYKGITPNVDFFSYFGEMYVLPIANFPHANVFAAFLSFLNIFHLKNNKYYLFILNILLITVLSSFAAIIFNLLLVVITYKRLTNLYKIQFLLFFVLILYFFSIYGFKAVSITERINQLNITKYLIVNNSLFGVGLNSFIPSINIYENVQKRIYILQPIHNIFLLLITEGGIFMNSFLILALWKLKRYLVYSPFLLFILVFGSFDHFLLTLNQGVLLLSLTILLHKSIINIKHV